MTHTVKRLLLLATFVAIGMAGANALAVAQTYTCTIINGCKCYLIFDPCGNLIGINCNCGSSGSGTFNTVPVPRAHGPMGGDNFTRLGNEDAPPPAGQDLLNVTLSATDISVDLFDQTLGNVHTSLDQSRTSPNTTIVSNSQTNTYPATGIINFYANATLASKPGIVYQSRTPLQFTNTSLTSFNPFLNETFRLAADVEFYDSADLSESTAFTLRAEGTNVTLGAPTKPGAQGLH
ncbi:MAG TPA: hypothetical protein VHI13_18245 [Candidatus Kapabacteria bacterium]|nr:hypothetical protein [Candidatus Kapabacteria bacterium]